ncbi:DASH complex subunit Ask1-domain-containing protein [Calycina marina]|uniref:DASH complex subunit ASK1 n=1 Tax=Calycina marina TaxID=1763456 RepID=A0A9P7ZD97_9HELO|nr:DASH complex subunit Ask1-domain-containing protein [Calycina marina]
MSRASTASARSLSLTEELEKLEQSITLTLQEIDHNFSRAHRIVTSSILPVVEQYAEHSAAVWEGSKFWKQFFEASANVSLSGVEEREEEEEEYTYDQSQETASNTYEARGSQDGDETVRTERGVQESYDETEDSILDNPDITGSTPRAPRSAKTATKHNFANYGSPYETLKRDLKGSTSGDDEDTQILPTTPGAKSRIPDMSMNPDSSPFDPTGYLQATKRKPGDDPLLHRVLDKNYRIQATPHKTVYKENKTPANKPSWRDNHSPMSSPPVAAPQLNSNIFGSPMRRSYAQPAPRTPGMSVNPSPAKKKERELFPKPTNKKDEISWESDSDDDAEGVYRELGMSPPKTIQFNLPQSRLLQTPAREASKKIVEDLMHTAGIGFDDSDDLNSPSVVVRKDELDDSF